jgi:hypothetical protein
MEKERKERRAAEKGRKEHVRPSSPAPACGGVEEDERDRPGELQLPPAPVRSISVPRCTRPRAA